MNTLVKLVFAVFMMVNNGSNVLGQESGIVADEHAGEETAEGTVRLNAQQLSNGAIIVAALEPAVLNYQVYAPGDIKANDYSSYLVSPRVDSLILRRHIALGDHVENGQALVTLFSEKVAEAQAAFLVASSERQRVNLLGREAVGENRFVAAQTNYQVNYSRLLSFGLSEDDIRTLTQDTALGEYTLTAESSGVVLSDDFRQGQWAEAGRTLIELADEQELWVESRLAPSLQLDLPAGTQARIRVNEVFYEATVSQEAHTIDPRTRTRVVRLLVRNEGDRLHPGQFADVYFSFATPAPVLAVPESALIRAGDGDWTVFVELDPGQFRAEEVELGRSLGELREIAGLEAGTRIVMEGAFFVASELAKSGFDAHNH